ncbi:hypothetical protein T4D_7832, partial [Trichinella pseudospiralis]
MEFSSVRYATGSSNGDGSNEKNDIKATNYQKCNDGTGIYVDENYEKENAVFYHQGFEGNDDVSTYEIVQTKFPEIEQKHSHQSNSTLDQLNARDEMLKQNTASATCDTILKNADFKFCMKQWIAGKGINYKILRTLNIDYLRPTNDNYIESIQQHVECFYEQPNGSLYTNKIYEDNTANYIQQIPQNILSQQQFIPQQPSNYTFQELNNFQNVNALANITDHAYNANYAYYQQNSPQETFNQQFIPQIEGNPYYENNLQAVYANKTVDPLSNYWQPQISLPQETFNQQFIPEPKGNPYYVNNLQANHQTIHPGPHLYECPDNKTYVNNNGAPYKYKTSRNPHGIFKCPLCNRIFQWVPAFRGHMNMHERRSEIPSNLSADLFDEISEKLRGKKTENRMTTTMQKIQAYIEKIDGSNEKNDIKATNYQKCNDGTGIYVDENYEKENAVFYHQGFEGNDDVSTYEIVQTKFPEIEQKHSHQSNSTLDQLNARDEMLKQNTASATCDTILKNADFKFCMKQWIAGKGINYKILRTLNIDYLRPTNDNYIESIQQHVECFYEQPNGSLYTNKIYEDNTANYIQQIPQNILSQQQFIPQQPSNYTFQELNNFQNVNALANITDHAYNANYAYYQQNSPQETFNQQFIPQIE